MRTDPVVIDLGVIDLGTDRSGRTGGPDPATPTPPPMVPRHPAAWLRRWWPLATLAVVLVASTSAAGAASPGLVPLFQVAAQQRTSVALAADTLYVATGTPVGVTTVDPEWIVSAYRLADGALLWTVPHDVTARPSSISVRMHDGVPVVTGWRTYAQNSRPPVHVDARTTAYEPDTGAVRWTRAGFTAPEQPPGRVVLDQVRYEGNDPPEPVEYLTSTVDLATGELLWDHRLPLVEEVDRYRVGTWALSEDGQYLAVLGRAGWLEVHDLATGDSVFTHLGQPWHDASLIISGATLRVSMRWERHRTVAALDLFPLTPRWELTDLSPTTSLTFCGPVLCLRGPDGLAGLDPASGESRWQGGADWTAAQPVPLPWPDGHLQVTRSAEADRVVATAGPAEPAHLIVDAATGQAGLALGRWLPMDSGGHPYPLVHQREAATLVPGHPDYDPGRLWLGRIDAGLSRVEVLGHLDGVRACTVGRWHLACVTTGQQVVVRRLPP